MLITHKATPIDGTIVAGCEFIAVDDDSAFAVFDRNDRICGIIYESGANRPYLRCSPGYQLPPFARDNAAWKKFTWGVDDERAFEVRLDESDGELSYIYRTEDLLENLEESIEDVLGFLTGDEFYGTVVDFVHEQMTA